jgi:phosphoadenosine phosphosulfate reductase
MHKNFKQSLGVGYFEARHISGVRAQEAGYRMLAMRKYGVGDADSKSCRPIGWWPTEYVFAYLARHDLPTHPAYALSMGGTYPRDKIRVDDLGCDCGNRYGRYILESHYYRRELKKLAALGVVING